MYSPLSDLDKMTHVPSRFIFKVRVGEREYFCRVHELRIGNPTIGILDIYETVMAFQRGEVASSRLEVTNDEVIGMEVIDTKIEAKPAPINVILAYCNMIDEIRDNADIWVVKNTIPSLLEKLIDAIEEFCIEYKIPNPDPTIDSLSELIPELKDAEYVTLEQKRKDMIKNVKEVVCFQIYRLISTTP